MRNMVVYPGQTLPIVVGRTRSRTALESAIQSGLNKIILVAQKQELSDQEPVIDDLFKTGVLAQIDRYDGGPERAYQVMITSLDRFAVAEYKEANGFLVAYGDPLADLHDVEGETLESLVNSMKGLASEIFELLPGNTERLSAVLKAVNDPALLSHLVAQNLDVPVTRKQELLEMTSLKNRLLSLLEQMYSVREQLKLQREVNQKLSSRLGKQHREAILREQIRTKCTSLKTAFTAIANMDRKAFTAR